MHVERLHLYALYWALKRHNREQTLIDGLTMDEELTAIVTGLRADQFDDEPAKEHQLPGSRVKEIVDHCAECQDCLLIVYEEGPTTKRRKSKADMDAEAELEEEARRQMKSAFFVHLSYGGGAFVGANLAMNEYRARRNQPQKGGPKLQSVNARGLNIDPYFMLFIVLILVASWGLAEAWRIANHLWLDWSKAKEAVPFVGKAWAEKGRKQKAEEERLRKKGS